MDTENNKLEQCLPRTKMKKQLGNCEKRNAKETV